MRELKKFKFFQIAETEWWFFGGEILLLKWKVGSTCLKCQQGFSFKIVFVILLQKKMEYTNFRKDEIIWGLDERRVTKIKVDPNWLSFGYFPPPPKKNIIKMGDERKGNGGMKKKEMGDERKGKWKFEKIILGLHWPP